MEYKPKRFNNKVILSVTLASSLIMSGSIVSASSINGVNLKVAVVQSSIVNVTIDGKKQTYSQPAFQQNGNTLVPLRGIFETLGAKVDWNSTTKTVTATKGATTIKLTLNSDTAYVNGKAVKITAKAQSINGNTMVPLRFVSEALGAKVDWNQTTKTAIITSVKEQAPVNNNGQVVGGIKVQYGTHDYSSKNQAEYDAVMGIIKTAVAKYGQIKVTMGGRYEKQFKMYLNGEIASDYQRGSLDERGLIQAEGRFGELVKSGVSADKIEKAAKTGLVANSLLNRTTNGIKEYSLLTEVEQATFDRITKTHTPRSAYDALVNKVTDCDPDAQVRSAVFDAMGYNTMVIGGTGHADVLVKIDGKWYRNLGDAFDVVDVNYSLSHGAIAISLPTFGNSTLK